MIKTIYVTNPKFGEKLWEGYEKAVVEVEGERKLSPLHGNSVELQ